MSARDVQACPVREKPYGAICYAVDLTGAEFDEHYRPFIPDDNLPDEDDNFGPCAEALLAQWLGLDKKRTK